MVEEHGGNSYLPVAASLGLELIGGGALPVVEGAYQVDAVGIGGPLAEHPFLALAVEAVEHMVVDPVLKLAFAGNELAGGLNPFVPGVDRPLERHQVLVNVVYHSFSLIVLGWSVFSPSGRLLSSVVHFSDSRSGASAPQPGEVIGCCIACFHPVGAFAIIGRARFRLTERRFRLAAGRSHWPLRQVPGGVIAARWTPAPCGDSPGRP